MYPVLHYLQSVELKASLALSLCRLDKAITIILYGYNDKCFNKAKFLIFKKNVDYFLQTLKNTFIRPVENVPALPKLLEIKDAVSVEKPITFEDNMRKESKRRQLLYGLILSERRKWDNISLLVE